MSYTSTTDTGHDLIDAVNDFSAMFETIDFSKPIPLEDCYSFYRLLARVSMRTELHEAALGQDYRNVIAKRAAVIEAEVA